jgi:hypothetical protein
MRRKILALLAVVCCALLAGGPAHALDQPSGKVILTVTGAITQKNQAGSAVFTLAMLDALPQASFRTATPWFKGPVLFSGPRLKDVMAEIGAKGVRLKVTALDDYLTNMPFSDIATTGALLATRIDGKPIPLATKGPLMIVFDFDGNPQLRSETYYDRSSWQIYKMEIIN